ncbi:MAG TPA: DUF4870 domain-containing protein [Phycisphaerales bacterium]|nr:DUF4870 domain-containing protein [Phycisphaerales bacterium]
MSDQTEPTTPPPPSHPEPVVVPPTTPTISDKEVADGKTFAILCYAINLVGFPFWLIPLIGRDNAFSLYHAKQCLILWCTLMVGVLIAIPLSFVCVGVVMFPLLGIANIVMNVLGVMSANKGQTKPLPVIGPWGEKWFAGITYKPKA